MFDPEGTIYKPCAYENGIKHSNAFDFLSTVPQVTNGVILYFYDYDSKTWQCFEYKTLEDICFQQYEGNQRFVTLLAHCMYLLSHSDCENMKYLFVNCKIITTEGKQTIICKMLRLENINTGMCYTENICNRNEGHDLYTFWKTAFTHIEYYNGNYIVDESKSVGDSERYDIACSMENLIHKSTNC